MRAAASVPATARLARPSSRGVCSRWRTTIASSSRSGAAAKLPSRWPSNATRRPSSGSAGTCSDRSRRPRTRCSRPSPRPTTISCATPSGRSCSSRGCSQSRETAACRCCGPGASSRRTVSSGPRTGLAEQVEQRAELRQLLADSASCHDEQRAALLLAELGDLSHAEIAGVLGCEVPRVKALVFRARIGLIARREARDVACDRDPRAARQPARRVAAAKRAAPAPARVPGLPRLPRAGQAASGACSPWRCRWRLRWGSSRACSQRSGSAAARPRPRPGLALASVGGGFGDRDAGQGGHRGSAGGRGCGCHAGASWTRFATATLRSERPRQSRTDRQAAPGEAGARRPASSGRPGGDPASRVTGTRRPEGRAAGACRTRGRRGAAGGRGQTGAAPNET